MRTADETTFEIGNVKLKLRNGLRFTLHQSQGEPWYLVEDETRNRFFQVGLPEYTLLSLLNGTRTLSEAVARTAMILGEDAFTEQAANRLSMWVVESELAETNASVSFARVLHRERDELHRERLGYLNLISTRINLFNPDSLANLGSRWLGWMICWPMALVWLTVVFISTICLLRNWNEFWLGRIATISSMDLVWFALTWMVIKVFHEASHAIVCRRLGGRVPKCGVLLLLFIPLPFVDLSSSWRLESKYQRILISAAGLISEIFIASVAICAWVQLEPGVLRFHCGNIFIATTLHTLIFNLNPLMRFDGYYMLADWLEIPNLYTRGRQHVKSVSCNLFFNRRQEDPTSNDPRCWTIRIYGWLALVWSVVICCSLTLAAIGLFEGVGLVIGVVAAVFWLGVPSYQLISFLIFGSANGSPDRVRFAAVVCGVGVGAAMMFAWLPAPSMVSLPVVVEYDPLETIRADTEGVISHIHVQSGQKVVSGQLLLELANPELESSLEMLKIEKQQSAIKLRQYKDEEAVDAWQQQLSLDHALAKRLDELERLVGRLCVHANFDGVVVSDELSSMQGLYVTAGTELMQIGNTDSIKLVGMLRQEDSRWINRLISDSGEQKDKWLSTRTSFDVGTTSCKMLMAKRAVQNMPVLRTVNHSTDNEVMPRLITEICCSNCLASANDGTDRISVDVEYRIFGTYGGVFPARIKSIHPRTTDSLTHPSFSASFGGPLTVVDREMVDGPSKTQRPGDEAGNLKLARPHVVIELSTPNSMHERFRAGQMGVAHIRLRDASLGDYLYSRVRRLLQKSVTRSHGL